MKFLKKHFEVGFIPHVWSVIFALDFKHEGGAIIMGLGPVIFMIKRGVK